MLLRLAKIELIGLGGLCLQLERHIPDLFSLQLEIFYLLLRNQGICPQQVERKKIEWYN